MVWNKYKYIYIYIYILALRLYFCYTRFKSKLNKKVHQERAKA